MAVDFQSNTYTEDRNVDKSDAMEEDHMTIVVLRVEPGQPVLLFAEVFPELTNLISLRSDPPGRRALMDPATLRGDFS